MIYEYDHLFSFFLFLANQGGRPPPATRMQQGYILYVQEVVPLQKKYLIYLHQKIRFAPFINYYDTLG